MKGRCLNRTDWAYNRYGGRGITVCQEWQCSYETFKAWAIANGYEEHLTIDRADNDQGYAPGNCRWVTYEINNRNRRSNKLTEEIVVKIRQRLASGERPPAIAKDYGVDRTSVNSIRDGRTWRGVNA
jgi:hypothetical protein